MPKVIISDKIDPSAIETLEKNGVAYDYKPDITNDEMCEIIAEYDGVVMRSATQITPKLLANAKNLKAVVRAGVGVDNIDIPSATEHGVVIMNTPFGNSITTAEHTIGMIFSVARTIPQASASTKAGQWAKKEFIGSELHNKVLGVVGCGNIGSQVSVRALALGMKVIAYDPYIKDERFEKFGVKKVSFDELLAQSDFITLHVPKTDETMGMINKAAMEKMKDGVRIVNCARGGVVVEKDLIEMLNSGKVRGAALDVFEVEPAIENPLFEDDRVICTPHLGSGTKEAQVNVAVQATQQISDFLLSGAVTNALNTPSVSAEEAPRLQPYLKLAEQIGEFAGQITESAIEAVEIEYSGTVTELNTDPITSTLISRLLRSQVVSANLVNALQVAKDRGITIKQSYDENGVNWRSMLNVVIKTNARTRNVTGTLFTGKEPRIVNVEGVPIEVALSGDALFIRNEDKPGLIGGLGSLLADAGHNIADFRLGRKAEGGDAICVVSLDAPLSDELFEKVKALPLVRSAKRLKF
ncbi:MAG: phosphoglycerate dehydrogenase [Alphaproteobacteria bacterium]